MVEKVEIGDATLYCGDCLEVLPTLGRVDVTITDPPYGEKTHAGARTQPDDFYKMKNRVKPTYQSSKNEIVDFSCIKQNDLSDICSKLCALSARWVVMTCEWQHAAILEESGVPLVRLGVWIKPNGAPQFTGDRPGTGWEAVAIMHRPGKKRWNRGGHHAVWTVPIEQGQHPTQKPIRLISEWVSAFSETEETILDPFMGSGTTGVACIQLGRKFIGIERERKYFDIACERIAKEHAQPRFDLVSAPEKAAEQMTML
jgi:site-specific DNA-methyltransferase (adenine-specific)